MPECWICQEPFEASGDEGLPEDVCVVCTVEDGRTWAGLSQAQKDAAMARFLRTMRASGPEA